MQNDDLDDIESDLTINLIIANMPGYVYWKDLNSVYRGCNINLAKLSNLESPSDIVGKTDFDFEWGKLKASEFIEQDAYVIKTGKTYIEEHDLPFENEIRKFKAEKRPLIGKSGKVVGIFGFAVDITAEKEAQRLTLENERQQIILEEQEKFSALARNVAHDLKSPLTSMQMMINSCTELEEYKRIGLHRSKESILDIVYSLIANYQVDQPYNGIEAEPRKGVLVSDLLVQILNEKKVEFRDNKAIHFEITISDNAQFAFIRIQKSEFRRAISNLINNAVDALKEKKEGKVIVRLTATSHAITLSIEDNGKGMSTRNAHDMERGRFFTEGKKDGHGLGLQQVWGMLKSNRGRFTVQSELDQGTTLTLTFPRITAARWIAQEMRLTPDQTIVVLDDDQSVHDAWNMHFAPLLTTYPKIRLRHFTHGNKALSFVNGLAASKKDNVMLLSDYELLHQDRNGIEIIRASKIKQSILVTSYYGNAEIREAATKLKIKILPKQMTSIIPIHVE